MNSETSSRKCKKAYRGPVVVVCGPTGSGKTGVTIKLARDLGSVLSDELGGEPGEIMGEITSADSRAIYKYMDIGTAKPTVAEREGVIHFGLDLVEPGERYTVADWKAYAEKCIEEIRERGHVPIVAGGTGLYVDALVYGYHFGAKGTMFGSNGNNEQKSYSSKTEMDAEFAKMYPDRTKMRTGFLVYGIKWDSEELRNRLMIREQKLYSEELYAETRFLVEKYGWGSQAMKSNIYQFAWKYLTNECTKEQAIEQNFYDDWHLAKRQMTWFKRNPEIRWCRLDEIEDRIVSDLRKSL